jgi:hypothetical protein
MATYCFDLDGTLCETEFIDGKHYYLNSKPILEHIQIVNKLYDEGNIIIIETSRGCSSGINWFQDTVKQLISWGLHFHTVRTGVKFGADYYIDDRAINAKDFFENMSY